MDQPDSKSLPPQNGANGKPHEGAGNHVSPEVPAAQESPEPDIPNDGLPPDEPSRPGNCSPEEWESRVEQTRGWIRLGFRDGEIKKKGSAEWGIKPRSVDKYLTSARKRNREYTGVPEDQNLAESLAYWTKKLQEHEILLQAEFRRYLDASKTHDKTAEEVSRIQESGEATVSTERLEILEMRLENASKAITQARAGMWSHNQSSKDCRREIDRLLGVHAPIKHAETTKGGQDVNKPAGEPVTLKAADEEIAELLEKLRARGNGVSVN